MGTMSELEVQRCSRKCHETGRELLPGESVFSALCVDQGRVVRRDYSAESWRGPGEQVIGWWRTQLPMPHQSVVKMAAPAIIVRRFEQLVDQGADHQLISVLGLLLVRKRWLREDDSPDVSFDAPIRRWFCPITSRHFQLPRFHVDSERAGQLQAALLELIYGDAEAEEGQARLDSISVD